MVMPVRATEPTHIDALSLHDALPISMPQEEFNGPRILLVVRELIAAPMPELRRMHREPKPGERPDRKSTRLNSSHLVNSYAVFCLKEKNGYLSHNNSRVRRR